MSEPRVPDCEGTCGGKAVAGLFFDKKHVCLECGNAMLAKKNASKATRAAAKPDPATRIAELEAALAASRASRERLAAFVRADDKLSIRREVYADSLDDEEGSLKNKIARAEADKEFARAALTEDDLA